MVSRVQKLRFRRALRMRRRQVETVGQQTDQYVLRRLERLVRVRRFVAIWITLIVVLVIGSVLQTTALSNYYQELRPTGGGAYTEGIVGSFSNASPVYASSTADRAVSKLLFSGLLTFDKENNLSPDLAANWKADARGQVYTVTLRDDLRWHDGAPLTSDDVVFTYSVIQNPDARSPLNASFQGVTVKALDAKTVTFTLANPLASFPYSLTNGLIPKHVLQDVPMADLRTIDFNTAQPVGSGPFQWQELSIEGNDPDERQERIALSAFQNYHHGRAKLDNITIRTFQTDEQMIASYQARELDAMAGLLSYPSDVTDAEKTYEFPQTAAMMTFFKTTSGVLADKAVRQALVRSADPAAIRKSLGYNTRSVEAPILEGQLGYDPAIVQLPPDIAAAKAQLEAAGWVLPANSTVRQKDQQKLTFTLYAESSPEAATVTRLLQQQWAAVGASVKVELQTADAFQITLSEHSYDALLRGISIGADPDVFVYWHSSQADVLARGRLNFSEYKSPAADEALALARTRTDANIRIAKYKPFLTAWRDDAPALGLYQPRVLYITRDTVYGLEAHTVTAASDRFANVHEWMIRRVKTTVD